MSKAFSFLKTEVLSFAEYFGNQAVFLPRSFSEGQEGEVTYPISPIAPIVTLLHQLGKGSQELIPIFFLESTEESLFLYNCTLIFREEKYTGFLSSSYHRHDVTNLFNETFTEISITELDEVIEYLYRQNDDNGTYFDLVREIIEEGRGSIDSLLNIFETFDEPRWEKIQTRSFLDFERKLLNLVPQMKEQDIVLGHVAQFLCDRGFTQLLTSGYDLKTLSHISSEKDSLECTLSVYCYPKTITISIPSINQGQLRLKMIANGPLEFSIGGQRKSLFDTPVNRLIEFLFFVDNNLHINVEFDGQRHLVL